MAVTPITYIGRLVAQDNDLPTLDTMYDVAYRYTSITASMNAAIPAFYSLNTDSDLTSSSIWSYLEDGNPATTIAADEDFTVEFWMQLEKTGLKQTIIDGARNNNLWIHLGTANKLIFDLGTTSTSHTCASYAFAASTWYHIAFVRSGGTVTYYVNGDALETWTMNVALSIPASIRYGQLWNGVTASRQFYGYLAGVCILRGAKYTAPFAPPMTPAQYEDVTSAPVELFELIGNTVTDRYGHNLTKTDISTSGDATFLGQNTLFFNGTSSVLTTALYCGKAADFTIDWWCKPNSVSNYNNWNTVLEWRSDLTSGRGYYCHIMTRGEYIYSAPSVATSSSGYASGPTSYHGIGGNSWNHYAIVKRGGTCYFYINGVQHAVTYATSNYMWPTLLSVGKCAFTSGYYSGYVAHLRVCCGARWTGNFAVPNNLADYGLNTAQKWDITNSAPSPASLLLLNSLSDSSSGMCTIANNGVILSTAQTKVSASSLYFNGSASISTTTDAAIVAGNDFTLDWWEYRQNGGTLCCLNVYGGGTGYSNLLIAHQSGVLYGSSTGNSWNLFNGAQAFDNSIRNTWTHYALVKSGNTFYCFKNGVQYWTATQATPVTFASNNTGQILIGKHASSSNPDYFQGYIDGFRFSPFARWTASFVPPNSAANYADKQMTFSPGTILECNYSGKAIPVTLPRGAYKLECWGASGGYYQGTSGGRGGYSCGTLTLQDATKLHLYAGGMGEDFENYKRSSAGNVYAGGFNGGGSAKVVYYSGTTTIPSGGGGGTDIRIGTNSLYARVIVAGGGSGATNGNVGYVGGGESGGGYNTSFAGKATAAGTHGAFGVGASSSPSSTNYKHSGTGAGGGWYGGGATSTYSDSDTSLPKQAGGGSGYVYAQASAQNYPSGCLLNSAQYLADGLTKAGSEAIPEINGDTACASQFGHAGYIRVTVLNVPPAIYLRTSAGWKRVRDVCTNQNTSGWTSIIESSADVIRATLASAITAVSPNNVEYVWRKCTRDANTKLLLKFDDGVTDVSGNDVALVSQGVTTSDAQSKFGGKSGYFNGSTAWIDFTVKSVFNPNADWTIDWWEYIETKVTAACIYNQTNGIHNNDRGILLGYQSSSNNEYAYVTDSASGWTIADSKTMGALTTGQWVHRAVVRSGSTYYTFRDGVQQATWTSTKSILSTATLGTIGRYANGIKYYKGYIDEFRISDVARWTSSFTAPATPHTAINIVGYVTSPSPRAYPDGEMASDGFYYERI